MKMDTILQACMENVLNVLADQDDEDFDDPLDFLSPSLRSRFLRSKKTREMFTGESTAHRSRLDQLIETEERLANEISDERNRFYQLRETEERLTEELRAMYETQTGIRSQPVAKRRRLNSEANLPDVAQNSDDSDIDFDDILKEEERDLQRCRQQLNIANRQLERERKRNKILEDMLLAIRNRTS